LVDIERGKIINIRVASKKKVLNTIPPRGRGIRKTGLTSLVGERGMRKGSYQGFLREKRPPSPGGEK